MKAKKLDLKSSVKTETTKVEKKEEIRSFGKDLWHDIVLPILKRGASTTLKTAVEWIFGESGSTNRTTRNPIGATIIDYRRESERAYLANNQQRGRSLRIDNFIFDYEEDAEKVLCELTNIIDQYGFATINNLYDLCNKSCPYTGEDYGWLSASGFGKHFDHGYGAWVLDLPNARPRRRVI